MTAKMMRLWMAALPLTMACKSTPGDGASKAPAPATAPDGTSLSVREEPVKGQAETPAPLTFGWKLPCRIPIDEQAGRGNGIVGLRFLLTVTALGDQLEARFENMEFVEFGGQPVTPAIRDQMGPAMALATTIPPMIVSPEGKYLETRGIDEVLDRLFASGLMKVDAKTQAAMRSPAAKKAISDKTGDYWSSWVGTWVGVRLAPGEKREIDQEVPVGSQHYPQHVRVENLGDAGPGLVHLVCTTRLDVGTEFVNGFVKDVGASALPDAGTGHLHREGRLEVETDPRNLLPRRVRQETTTVVDADGKTKSTREIREDTFDWSRAIGCR